MANLNNFFCIPLLSERERERERKRPEIQKVKKQLSAWMIVIRFQFSQLTKTKVFKSFFSV